MVLEQLTVITLTAGTMFVMWLGEQITERGIGNGISLIIFAGIAAGIPSGIRDTINLFKNGELTGLNLLLVGVIMVAAFWIIIYTEKAFRKKFLFNMQKELLIIEFLVVKLLTYQCKVNISGVMPPIFASALLGFPTTISTFILRG